MYLRDYGIQDLTMLGPDRLVIVASDQHPTTTRAIRESIEMADRTGTIKNVQHLLRQGWFVRMDDSQVTIKILRTGEYQSYPLEQIVVCLGMDILMERINARRDEN
jgi:predicted transcriptional regulator of viral defense system